MACHSRYLATKTRHQWPLITSYANKKTDSRYLCELLLTVVLSRVLKLPFKGAVLALDPPNIWH